MATDNPIEAYQKARRVFDTATNDAERLVQVIVEAKGHLKSDQSDWRHVVVVTDGGPVPTGPYGGAIIDAQTWPSGGKLAQALSAWHRAEESLRVAWDRIPEVMRVGLKPPSEQAANGGGWFRPLLDVVT